MHHFRAEEPVTDLAERAYELAWRELFHLARIEIEEAQREHASAIFHVAYELPSGPELHVAFDNAPLNEYVLGRGCITDRVDARFVVVTQRQMENQVDLTRNAETCEVREGGFVPDDGRARRNRRRDVSCRR